MLDGKLKACDESYKILKGFGTKVDAGKLYKECKEQFDRIQNFFGSLTEERKKLLFGDMSFSGEKFICKILDHDNNEYGLYVRKSKGVYGIHVGNDIGKVDRFYVRNHLFTTDDICKRLNERIVELEKAKKVEEGNAENNSNKVNELNNENNNKVNNSNENNINNYTNNNNYNNMNNQNYNNKDEEEKNKKEENNDKNKKLEINVPPGKKKTISVENSRFLECCEGCNELFYFPKEIVDKYGVAGSVDIPHGKRLVYRNNIGSKEIQCAGAKTAKDLYEDCKKGFDYIQDFFSRLPEDEKKIIDDSFKLSYCLGRFSDSGVDYSLFLYKYNGMYRIKIKADNSPTCNHLFTTYEMCEKVKDAIDKLKKIKELEEKA